MAWCSECQEHYPNTLLVCPTHDLPLEPSRKEEEDPLVGENLEGRYTIEALIGEGAMGRVYRARQIKVDRAVAIKVLNAVASRDSGIVARFESEARIISQLRHPNTLKLFDFGRTDDDQLFIVIELLKGLSLEDELAKGPIGAERTIRILGQVFEALSEAHELGVIHRDLKPANIMLETVGGYEVVKVVDFGIAKVLSGTKHTATGHVVGTPAYMSPEQATATELTSQSDLYSLGIVAYECLTGNLPFAGSSAHAIMLSHCKEQPRAFSDLKNVPSVPAELERFVMQLVEKKPENRPGSARLARKKLKELDHRLAGVRAKVNAKLSFETDDTVQASFMELDGRPKTATGTSPGQAPPPRMIEAQWRSDDDRTSVDVRSQVLTKAQLPADGEEEDPALAQTSSDLVAATVMTRDEPAVQPSRFPLKMMVALPILLVAVVYLAMAARDDNAGRGVSADTPSATGRPATGIVEPTPVPIDTGPIDITVVPPAPVPSATAPEKKTLPQKAPPAAATPKKVVPRARGSQRPRVKPARRNARGQAIDSGRRTSRPKPARPRPVTGKQARPTPRTAPSPAPRTATGKAAGKSSGKNIDPDFEMGMFKKKKKKDKNKAGKSAEADFLPMGK